MFVVSSSRVDLLALLVNSPQPRDRRTACRGSKAMAEAEGPYWFSVKYGVGETALFNANCWAVVLTDYMKERCGYGDLAEPVDLQKEDGSNVGLLELKKNMANEVLDPKGTYILCKVNPGEDGAPSTYEQLYEPAAPDGEEPPAAAPAKKK